MQGGVARQHAAAVDGFGLCECLDGGLERVTVELGLPKGVGEGATAGLTAQINDGPEAAETGSALGARRSASDRLSAQAPNLSCGAIGRDA